MGHKLVLGVDEAGYGPSMGPFVVVATAWRVPESLRIENLSEMLTPEFQPVPIRSRANERGVPHVPLGDSKKVYAGKLAWESLSQSARFLLSLERESHELQWNGSRHSGVRDAKTSEVSQSDTLAAQLYPWDWTRIQGVPWLQSLTLSTSTIPESTGYSNTDFAEAKDAGVSKMRSLGVEFVASRGRLIDEIEWNRLVHHFQNKSSVLSDVTLSLARDLAKQTVLPEESIEIYCDKHGGRNRYLSLLMHAFDDRWFETHAETGKLSRYSTQWGSHPLTIQFRVEGDSIVPSAAASILAKWTRELAMNALNEFWGIRATKNGLAPPKPTAGYYVDAMRFSQDIQQIAEQYGPPKSDWWRAK